MATMKLTINGQPHSFDADPNATLLSVLREQLDLTGTKYGCGEGQCGLRKVHHNHMKGSPKPVTSILLSRLSSMEVPCSARTALRV